VVGTGFIEYSLAFCILALASGGPGPGVAETIEEAET
jgi:hypothetical protein